MLCEILYLENSDKAKFFDLKNNVENDYALNKAEYSRRVTSVQIILLNYQHNCKFNRNPQYNGFNKQLMYAQHGKTGDDEGDRKKKEQRPRRNLDHITCKNCGEKDHYNGNNDCPTQARLKEDEEAFRKMKQNKYSNKPPGGGDQKALGNVKDTSYSLMMGAPTEEWVKPPSTGINFCQTST